MALIIIIGANHISGEFYMKIQIKEIRKAYGKHQVLKNIDLTVEGGKCVGILGGNGCGKSTLLSILAGIQPADSGEFLFDDKNLFDYTTQRSHLVGYVPQGIPMIEELTAKDNLSLWYDKKEMQKQLESGVLKMLGVDNFLNVPVYKMSGGMKKRLSIGCAVAHKPPVLILDEPMAALDISCKQKICDYIRVHKEKGGIVLIASHDIMEIALCDQWYIIKDGYIKEFNYTGEIDELVRSL